MSVRDRAELMRRVRAAKAEMVARGEWRGLSQVEEPRERASVCGRWPCCSSLMPPYFPCRPAGGSGHRCGRGTSGPSGEATTGAPAYVSHLPTYLSM